MWEAVWVVFSPWLLFGVPFAVVVLLHVAVGRWWR
jgi:hypothetical protein